jgi:dTDP-glucose pyrophosphorylase
MKNDISNRIVNKDLSIVQALQKMDNEKIKMLFVYDSDQFKGLITIGDIQRAILANTSLTESISTILDLNKIYSTPNEPAEEVRGKMLRLRAECMPVVDTNGQLVDVYFWEDFFSVPQKMAKAKLNVPVVIMAGGKGTRLLPLTNVIPKPLIPLGDRTILEIIMDNFSEIGCERFYLSLGYKSEIIKYYLNNADKKYNIEYITENLPLGTIGSIALLKNKFNKPFFVSNCDIIIDQDYRDVYEYHQNNKNDLTMIVAIKSYKIPYGVVKVNPNGVMAEIEEKPDMTYMINTGIYILNPELIDLIPQGKSYHVTHLMQQIKDNGGRVGCFPVSEGSWTDIGDWGEYMKYLKY